MKRRPISCMMFVLTAFSLTIAVVLPGVKVYSYSFLYNHPAYLNESGKRLVTILCPLLAKMFNSIVWSVLPLAMSEMIPTVIRWAVCDLFVRFIDQPPQEHFLWWCMFSGRCRFSCSAILRVPGEDCKYFYCSIKRKNGFHKNGGLKSTEKQV